jgi:DNA helicase HerA-like ATPase
MTPASALTLNLPAEAASWSNRIAEIQRLANQPSIISPGLTLMILPVAHGHGAPIVLEPARVNRHGLITGATGTGKTVTLQLLAERLSVAGVPVFMADVKGDLTGMAQPGMLSQRLLDRVARIGCEPPVPRGLPVVLWDVLGEQGHRLRATVSDMGPLLLGRMLGLNEVQQGVLQLIFKVADERGLLLLDLKDLRAMLQFAADNARELSGEWGQVSRPSIGAIQRALLTLEAQGAERFFGEPMLDIADLMRTDADGRGIVNILAADRLLGAPKLYATTLLWLLSELFEVLPEAGDLDRPKLVFFFDEAHLLFSDAPRVLVDRVEQVVRLIRSKGVGVFFVSQSPQDIPDAVLGQLGNRIQHALRAFTPADQKAVRAAAESLRPNPRIDAVRAIGELAVGEALVSLLDAQGRPAMVERGFILPPASRIGPLTAAERAALIASSGMGSRYDRDLDRESAYEMLKSGAVRLEAGDGYDEPSGGAASRAGGRGAGATALSALLAGAARSIGSTIGRELVRGLLGTMSGRRRR